MPFMPDRRELRMLLLVTAVHILLVRWALTLVTPEENVSLMWLPDGFLFAVFVLLRLPLWPLLAGIVFSSTLLIELFTTARPAGLIAWMLSANFFESAVGALVYRRWCGGDTGLRDLQHLTVFILVCVLGLPAISAVVGASAVVAYGLSDHFLGVYRTWQSSAGLGILFVAPLIVEGAVRWRKHRSLIRGHDGKLIVWLPASVMLITLLDTAIGLAGLPGSSTSAQGLIFVGLPLLCIAASKFGIWGGVLTSSVMVISAVQITAIGHGPFTMEGLSPAESVFRMQSYLAMAVIATLFTAVAVERMRDAQTALQTNLARFQTTFEHSPAALFEEDYSQVLALLKRSGMPRIGAYSWLTQHPEVVGRCAELVRVEGVNQRAVELFEAKSAQALRGGMASLVSAPSLEVFLEELAAFYSGRSRFTGEAVQTTLTGRFIETVFEANIVPGHERDWRRVIIAIQDVTEQQDAVHKLQVSERRFRASFDKALSGIALLTTGGRFTEVNQRLCELVGYSADELCRMNYIDLTHPEDRSAGEQMVQAMLQSGDEGYSMQKRYRHKNGDSVWIRVSGYTLRDALGATDCIIAFVKPIHPALA